MLKEALGFCLLPRCFGPPKRLGRRGELCRKRVATDGAEHRVDIVDWRAFESENTLGLKDDALAFGRNETVEECGRFGNLAQIAAESSDIDARCGLQFLPQEYADELRDTRRFLARDWRII